MHHKNINIHEIKTISRTNSLIASPAPSFNRIEITYDKFDNIILSPKAKLSSAKDLTPINPNIKNYVLKIKALDSQFQA